MKILLHGINFAPELTGIGKYTGEMAEWLAARGHEVRVVTAPPYYPAWRVDEGYSGWRFSKELLNGVHVWRCPLWVPSKPSGLKRILHLASFALSSLGVMLSQARWRPDLVWIVEPPLFAAPGALLAGRLSGAKVWLHVQDFEVDAAFELGLIKGKRLRRWVERGERWLLQQFDQVSTISTRMRDRLISKGVISHKAGLFLNWVDTSTIFPLDRPSVMREELGISENAVVALYSGNMGGKQGLELLAEAATRLVSLDNLIFVFCGDGAGKADLLAACQNLPNVRFLDLQPMDRLNELLNLADVHLLPQRVDVADLVMPSKLTGMLASGRGVLATAHPGTELAFVLANCGVVVPPGDPEAFAESLQWLVANPSVRMLFGEAGRRYAEDHFSREAVLGTFEVALHEQVSGRESDKGTDDFKSKGETVTETVRNRRGTRHRESRLSVQRRS